MGWGWDRVQAAAGEGMAAEEPPQGKGHTAQGAVGGDGHLGILRAGGQVAAAAVAQGMDRRGEPAAIEGEGGEQDAGHRAGSGRTGCAGGRFRV